jgi:light-regulated signal transduction histidine kinase (bacteriophytochrome)
MVSNDRLVSPTSPTSGSEWDDPLRRVRHDLRHALYVSDLALTLLSESRTDEGRFREVLQMLRKEQATMQSLVDDLLLIATSATPEAANVRTDVTRATTKLARRRA